MELQLETITSTAEKSFALMYNPGLSDLFFWHFHPEYELVYIEAESGPRHVGDHSSTYKGSDLVLIGSNIPHLNFDYGVKTAYRKAVVHLKKEFVEGLIQTVPELSFMPRLFTQSQQGIAFHGALKQAVGEQLFELEQLPPFDQYLALLKIFQLLSTIEEVELLHEKPYDRKYSDKEQSRLKSIHAYIDKHYHEKISLEAIAEVSHMGKEAFCRYFKKMTSYTFVEFLNRYRVSHSKRLLMAGASISDACYSSGFESLSYYNRVFKKVTEENPSDFRKRYLN